MKLAGSLKNRGEGKTSLFKSLTKKVINLSGQKFFHDQENDVFYLVNFQERRYMKIAEKGSRFYDLCIRLYCDNWKYAESNYKIISTFKKVERLEQIDGCED